MATHNWDDFKGKKALRAGGASREENSEARDEIRGLTSGDWGGLGNYLWELTLENSNLAKRRQEWAIQCIVRGRPS